LLLDSKGNLKVSDFGLSALSGGKFLGVRGSTRQRNVLKRSPRPATAPQQKESKSRLILPHVQLLMSKECDGAAVDLWSCGVILFELLADFLPFNDQNLMSLYHKECANIVYHVKVEIQELLHCA
jgi:5'-AMP-activated protein kinase catalytic alpha subunit